MNAPRSRAKGALARRPVWLKACREAADPARARHWLDLLSATPAVAMLRAASAEQARILAALFSGAQAMSGWLRKHPDWLQTVLRPENLEFPRQEQGLRREVDAWLRPALASGDQSAAAAFAQLRLFKQREMLRIAARDLARLADSVQITREISNVADVCLSAVFQLCRRQLTERLGQPYHQDAEGRWHPTEFAVLGLGKLGGQELNYSSDVDVMFVYSEEGFVSKEPPRPARAPGQGMSNHQFFKRLAETFIAEVTHAAPEGALYRIDVRLRPEGDAGPIVRSLASCENYYAQWGQTWERMMLLKARGVAGDKALAAEFLEMAQPFRYPRSLSEGVLREISAMKTRVENEVVKAGELDRNVKLGRGGIREVEFVAQTLQLLHGGRIPFLQVSQTLPALEKLVQYRLLPVVDAQALTSAYCFLRDVEHRLQMEHDLQTHTIPADARPRERLGRMMAFPGLKEFDAALRFHTRNVRAVYDKLLKAEPLEPAPGLPRHFDGAQPQWKRILTEHGFQDPERSFRLLKEFATGPGYVHVSPRTIELAFELLPRLFGLCPKAEQFVVHPSGCPVPADTLKRGQRTAPESVERLSVAASGTRTTLHAPRSAAPRSNAPTLSDPDRVLARLDSFIGVYGARATLFETWAHNPSLFDLLLLLFDRSEFLAERAIRVPDLVDELVLSGRLRRHKSAEEILRDLRHGAADEDQRLWLRRYHQAELMRIGLRDILGLADFEKNLAELSGLADACLQYTLEAVLRKHKLKKAPLAIIGLGKLGGQEINYGSDLDIIFVADAKVKNLAALQRVAVDVMEMLSSSTELGVAFATDARLRPDGEKGLLVNTLDAYEEYYRRRARLWEIQALSRARPIAGAAEVGRRFQALAVELTNFKKPSRPFAAYTADWKQLIAQMRRRIEKERTPSGQDALAIKTGAGGLMDAEFIAQALCLEHGWQEPNTLRALLRAGEERALTAADADKLIENYRQLRRVEVILRRWSHEGETVLPVEPAPFRRVSVRCGFATPEAFRDAVSAWRRAIREVYTNAFSD
jgi:glutamate-ammonia-ligase adenylyltransferase